MNRRSSTPPSKDSRFQAQRDQKQRTQRRRQSPSLKEKKKKSNRVHGLSNHIQTLQTLLRQKRRRANRTHEQALPVDPLHRWPSVGNVSPYRFGRVHDDQKQRQQQHFSSSAEGSASDLPTGYPISEIPAGEISNFQPSRGWRMKPAFCTPGTLLGCYPLGQGHGTKRGNDEGKEQAG